MQRLARNREMLAYYRQRLDAEFPGRYVIFGHIGDAHVHINLFSDPANPAHATGLLLELARKAVEFGGTVSAGGTGLTTTNGCNALNAGDPSCAGGGFLVLNGAHAPRIMQLGLRFQF